MGHNEPLFYGEMHNTVARNLLRFGLNNLVPISFKIMNVML